MKKKLLNGVKTLAITCRQFGDTGKGKFVDLFSEWADIIARGLGGDNCGHTSWYNGQELVTHLIPSGIRDDKNGKINLIGSGVVFNPKTAIDELLELAAKGISYDHLLIALNAKLITPADIVMDRIKEAAAGSGKIGSTGKGIGPTYADVPDRQGLIVNDLINSNFFFAKLKRHLENKARVLRNFDQELIKQILDHQSLSSGIYYNPQTIFDTEAIYEQYLIYGRELQPMITDTDDFMRQSLGKKNILLEGAQGDLLSVKHGTYPFVTSSDCTVAGLSEGVGLQKSDIDLSLGIIKGFYMSRVGCGPFPSELGRDESDKWCNGGQGNRQRELELYGQPPLNDPNEFLQGIALRQAGNEYGATTGRPRRVGWLDLPLLRYVLRFNSPDIILTKLDVLNDAEIIRICYQYEYCGPDFWLGNKRIKKGDEINEAIPYAEVLQHCRPLYSEFPGWQRSLAGCHSLEQLPPELKMILQFVVDQTGINPRIISIGADRDETIFV